MQRRVVAAQIPRDHEFAVLKPGLLRRALEASERVLGSRHPDTLDTVNSLAGLLDSKGDYAGAESLFRRALKGRERMFGPDRPDTRRSLSNLEGLLRKMRPSWPVRLLRRLGLDRT